ncbi:hypothetical protein SDC9_29865 [bioreactor metagenome]|uniref:Uncharacterized protein n=1 Tax=bioreactor metagenome TaxID=1076179 RepID=A0A644UXT7_9ZZZZ
MPSAGDQFRPLLRHPVPLVDIEGRQRQDRRLVGGHGGEFGVGQIGQVARHGRRGADIARQFRLHRRLRHVVDEDLRLIEHLRRLRHHPRARVEHRALLREGRAHRLALAGGEARHVVVILAHRDLAGFQRLLELALVAIPQPHVRLQLGELRHHLKHAVVGLQDVGAAEEGGRGDLEQERVRGERHQPELVLLLGRPQRLPRGRSLGEGRGVGDQADIPAHRAGAIKRAVLIMVHEMLGQHAEVIHLALVELCPQPRALALDARHLRHHRDIGRRLVRARRLTQLHQPGLARGFANRLDLDPGFLGEIGVDELVEAVLEIAAVGAHLQRRARGPQHRGGCKHRGAGRGGGKECTSVDHGLLPGGPACVSAAPRHAGQRAEHLEEEVRGDHRGVAGRIVGRRDLDQVAADKVQPGGAADDLEPLHRGQAADLDGAGAGREGRVEAVDVIAEIDRRIADLGADLGHQRRQRGVPALLGLDAGPALLAAPVEFLAAIAGAAQADLEHLVVDQAALFPRAAERAAMRDGLAEHVLVGVGMRVDMDQRDGAVAFLDRAQDRPGQGVVAAQGQRDHAVAQHLAVMAGDDLDRFLQVEGVDRHVADIGHLQRLEGRGAGRHVVGADHPAFVADLARAEAGARAVRGADIHRDAEEAGVEPRRRGRRRQAHHRGRSPEAGHGVAAKRLVQRFRHSRLHLRRRMRQGMLRKNTCVSKFSWTKPDVCPRRCRILRHPGPRRRAVWGKVLPARSTAPWRAARSRSRRG